jgi:two-component system KDP operon response regulator KdpE
LHEHPSVAGDRRRPGAGYGDSVRPEGRGVVTRVLVVDDEPPIVRAVAANLRVRGYEVVTAASGDAALAAMEAHQPDCVVLDLGLPGIDGLEVLRRLRRADDWERLPVVVTSIVQPDGGEPELGHQVRSWLVKPFSARQLQRAVALALDPHGPPSGTDDAGGARPDRRVQDTGQGLA